VPQVVCYQANNISYQIAKRIITIKYISLVNLIMDKEVVTELISAKRVVDKHNNYQKTYNKSKKQSSKKPPTIADKVVWTAVTYKGTPYKYAGITKRGMDCSGLIYTSFKEREIELPRSSSMLYTKGYKIPMNKVRRGDLLFFKTTNKTKSKINHVALVTSVDNNDVKFIHATSSRGVIVSSISEKYWKNAFIDAKRIIEN